MRKGVEITLRGNVLSGKTLILHVIGKALKDAGFNVKAVDEEFEFTTFETYPSAVIDDRPILIKTEMS